MNKFRCYFCLILGILQNSVLAAAPVILLMDPTNETESTALLPNIAFIQDAKGQITITDLLTADKVFNERSEDFVNIGFGQNHRWLRFTLENQTQEKQWYLEIGGSISSQVNVYAKENKTYTKQESLNWSIAHRYRLVFEPFEEATIYIQVYDPKGVARLSPTLFNESQMFDSISFRHAFYAFLVSGFLTLTAYNLLYFLYLRDTDFLTLAICISAYALAMANNTGLLHFFPWNASAFDWNNATFLFLVIISGFHLALGLLDIRRHLAGIVIWYYLGSIISVVAMTITLIFGNGLPIASLLGVYGVALVLFTLVKLYWQGYKLPKSLAAAIMIFCIAGLPLILIAIGVIEHHPQLNNIFFVAALISLLLISLTQAETFRLKNEGLVRTDATNQAKDEFLTTMSHELRTPMNAVVGAGQLLTLSSLSKEQKEFVSRLNHSSSHMLSLVNDLLDLARVDDQLLQIEKVPFSLEETLTTLKQLLKEPATKKHLNLKLDNRFFSLNKKLIGDPTRLNQVLLNLLGNAIKFTQKGDVTLTITPVEVNNFHAKLHFEVTDTGIGMTKEQQDRLFQPFIQANSSTNRHYGGSGLGLAISQKLVARMGGDLIVCSAHQQGSRFSFVLNYPLEIKNLAQEKENKVPSHNLSGYKVLLVDDDEMNRFFGRRLLENCGVDVEIAESGETAILLMQKQVFNLVFMDVSMLKVDGYETTRKIRQLSKLRDVIIVALTAYAVAGERERCIESGMDDYLTKPLELDDLRAMMVKWLDKSEGNT